MRLLGLCVVAGRMTGRTDRFNVKVMIGIITKIMVVLVPPFAFDPNVSAINTRQLVGMRTPARANFDVDSLPSLFCVPISGRKRSRTRTAGFWIYAERHDDPPVMSHQEIVVVSAIVEVLIVIPVIVIVVIVIAEVAVLASVAFRLTVEVADALIPAAVTVQRSGPAATFIETAIVEQFRVGAGRSAPTGDFAHDVGGLIGLISGFVVRIVY